MKLQITSIGISCTSFLLAFAATQAGRGRGMEHAMDGVGLLVFASIGLLIGLTIAIVAASRPTEARALSFISIPLPVILGLFGIPAVMG